MEGALILLIVYLIYHIYCKYAEEKGDEILHPGRKQSDLKEYSRYMDGLGLEDEENIFRCDNCEEPFSIYELHRGPNGETLCFSCLNEGVDPEDVTENYIAEKEKFSSVITAKRHSILTKFIPALMEKLFVAVVLIKRPRKTARNILMLAHRPVKFSIVQTVDSLKIFAMKIFLVFIQ
jgi:hypothetical protein